MQRITFPSGEQMTDEKEYSFFSQNDRSHSKLIITKEETAERTYKVAVEYLGMFQDRHKLYPKWQVAINDVHEMGKIVGYLGGSPVMKGLHNPLIFLGSTKLEFKQVSAHEILIKERDCENSNSETRVDTSSIPYSFSTRASVKPLNIFLLATAAFLLLAYTYQTHTARS